MTEIIISPRGMFGGSSADSMVDIAMRVIGVAFAQPDEWASKYGTDYENDVFMMHRYCWCEKPECLWCTIWLSNETDCSEDEARAYREKQVAWVREKYGDWAAEHPAAPNFWFKPTGFQLRWYKYIGRGMKGSSHGLPGDFMQQIFATHPNGMTVDQAVEKWAKAEEDTAESFQKMFASLGVKTA